MKKALIFALPVALLGTSAPVLADNVAMTDFRKPESRYNDAYVTGRFALTDGNQDQTSYNGAVLGDLNSVYSTAPYVWSITGNAQSEFRRGPNDGDRSLRGYSIDIGTTFDRYFKNDNRWFGYGGLDLGQRRLLGADSADNLFSAVTGGVGYGRVINATPLAYAIRIAEDLLAAGVINREPSKATYLTVANVIGRQQEYRSKYGADDYRIAWIQDIERALRAERGLMKSELLGAGATIVMTDILFDERVSTRKHGWIVRAGLTYVISNYDGNNGEPAFRASWEYAKPIGYRFQLTNLAEYTAVLSDDSADVFSNRLSATYEISDRIDWENTWTYTGVRPDNNGETDTDSHELASAFRYYLSNRISFDATVAFRDVEDDIDGNGNDKTDTSVFIGTTYRLR